MIKQTKLEEELQLLRSSHSKLEVELATHKEKLHGLSQIRSQLEVGIERERAQVARVRGELGEVEEHARSVERQLQEERREHHSETERLNKQAQEGRCVCACACVCVCMHIPTVFCLLCGSNELWCSVHSGLRTSNC